jgi:hypothetical protein
MSLARIKRIAAAAEAACNAVIADPAKPQLREQLFHALAGVVEPSFTATVEQSPEMAGLCRQARVWAQIVQERVIFVRRFGRDPGDGARAASNGFAHNVGELLRVLASIRASGGADG